MNLLFALTDVVPPGVVTATSTCPAACAGLTAVTVVAFTTVKLAAGVPPKVTALVPVRSVPVIVTAEGFELADGGILADVAPTILQMLGIDQPEAMTGRSLIEPK